jgi:hypothetical protein
LHKIRINYFISVLDTINHKRFVSDTKNPVCRCRPLSWLSNGIINCLSQLHLVGHFYKILISGMFGIPLESRVCFRKSEPLLKKKQSYAMRMKTHVFNYTSNWLQRAGVHWQSAGEQNSIKIHDTVSSSVQSIHCQGLVIRVFRNFKFICLCFSMDIYWNRRADTANLFNTVSPY